MAGLRIGYTFARPDVHPYDEIEWTRRDVTVTDRRDGSVRLHQPAVEFPSFWSDHAVSTAVTRYFRGNPGTPQRETSLRELIDRMVAVYRRTGAEFGYFDGADSADAFASELTWLLLHQAFSFNSPVWFNVGTGAP